MLGEQIILRRAELSDLEALMDIERACFPEPLIFHARYYQRLLGSVQALVVLAERQALAIGSAAVKFRPARRTARLLTIAVLPAYAGRGWGRQLLDEIVAQAQQRRCRYIELEVAADNQPALRLYESRGFLLRHRIADYYGDGQPAWSMRLWLQEIARRSDKQRSPGTTGIREEE